MVTFDSFKVDLITDQWQFYKAQDVSRLWLNPAQDVFQQRLILNPPDDLPRDYPNLASHQAYFEAMPKEENSSLVAVKLVTIGRIEGFSTLFKFKNSENPTGHTILGTVMLTFETFFCGFHFQADEHGTTGLREAGVYMHLKEQGKLPPEVIEAEKMPPRAFKSKEEFFDAIKARPALPHFSDDEQYDAAFPDHPLSRVRRYMKRVADTLEVDDEVLRAKPFHGPEWKPS